MSVVTVYPSGTEVYSDGTITWSPSASAGYLHDADDATGAKIAGGAHKYFSLPLENMPSDLVAVTAVTIVFRMRNQSVLSGHNNLDSVQIFAADGTTALTDPVTDTSTVSFATYTKTATVLVDDKSSWDGACIQLKQDANASYGTSWVEVSVAITYTSTGDVELIPNGYGNINAEAAFVGVGEKPSNGHGIVNADDDLTGVGYRSFTGFGAVAGFLDCLGVGEMPSGGRGTVPAVGTLIGVGSLPDSGFGTITAVGTLIGFGSLPDSGFGTINATVDLVGVGASPVIEAGGMLLYF